VSVATYIRLCIIMSTFPSLAISFWHNKLPARNSDRNCELKITRTEDNCFSNRLLLPLSSSAAASQLSQAYKFLSRVQFKISWFPQNRLFLLLSPASFRSSWRSIRNIFEWLRWHKSEQTNPRRKHFLVVVKRTYMYFSKTVNRRISKLWQFSWSDLAGLWQASR